jgi:hypothetical protein
MSQASTAPVVVELAPLPREQVGPFLLLGVEKTAEKEQVEAAWAKRVIWARKDQIKIALEDINWAREVINSTAKRIRADAASLNLDAADGVLKRLAEELGGQAAPQCQPLDVEVDFSQYDMPVEKPDIDAVRAQIVVPDVPMELPAAKAILEEFLRLPLDAWDLPVTW